MSAWPTATPRAYRRPPRAGRDDRHAAEQGFAPPVRGSARRPGGPRPDGRPAHGLITRSGFQVAENEGSPWSAATPSPPPGRLPSPTRTPDVGSTSRAPRPEAFGANLTCLHPVIEQTRPFPGLAATLRRSRLLAGSYLCPGAARFLQDPLTSAASRTSRRARTPRLRAKHPPVELNSSQSNPVSPERRIVSVGNFDIGPLPPRSTSPGSRSPRVTSANERGQALRPLSGCPPRHARHALPSWPPPARPSPEARTLPTGLLRAGQLGQGRRHRGPGHDAPLSARRLPT